MQTINNQKLNMLLIRVCRPLLVKLNIQGIIIKILINFLNIL